MPSMVLSLSDFSEKSMISAGLRLTVRVLPASRYSSISERSRMVPERKFPAGITTLPPVPAQASMAACIIFWLLTVPPSTAP